MKAHALLCCLVLAGLNTGCQFFYYSAVNMIEEPLRWADECHALRRFRDLAQEAWKHVCEMEPDHEYSQDYQCGFITGYVDYLDAGGNGEPPAAPPLHYQSSKYETPQGQKAILDWFAGFRHGAATARDSGQRELIVVPLSLPPKSSENVASERATRPTAMLPQQPVVPPPEEMLPPPRQLPDGKPGTILFPEPRSPK